MTEGKVDLFMEMAALLWLGRLPEDLTPGRKDVRDQMCHPDNLIYPEGMEKDSNVDLLSLFQEDQIEHHNQIIKATLTELQKVSLPYLSHSE